MTTCRNGHELNAANTRFDTRKNGTVLRACRVCDRERKRASYKPRRRRNDPLARLGAHFVFDPSGCWIWTSATDGDGIYGRFWLKTGVVAAHRFVYEILVGPIPEGLTLDHLCRRTLCVNPAHLEPVTHRENTLRGTSPLAEKARQTQCVHGHLFTPENTIRRGPDGRHRQCRTCKREQRRRARAYMARKRAARSRL